MSRIAPKHQWVNSYKKGLKPYIAKDGTAKWISEDEAEILVNNIKEDITIQNNRKDIKINKLKLQPSLIGELNKRGIIYVGDLKKIEDKTFLTYDRLGKSSLNKLKKVLISYGYLNTIFQDVKNVVCFAHLDSEENVDDILITKPLKRYKEGSTKRQNNIAYTYKYDNGELYYTYMEGSFIDPSNIHLCEPVPAYNNFLQKEIEELPRSTDCTPEEIERLKREFDLLISLYPEHSYRLKPLKPFLGMPIYNKRGNEYLFFNGFQIPAFMANMPCMKPFKESAYHKLPHHGTRNKDIQSLYTYVVSRHIKIKESQVLAPREFILPPETPQLDKYTPDLPEKDPIQGVIKATNSFDKPNTDMTEFYYDHLREQINYALGAVRNRQIYNHNDIINAIDEMKIVDNYLKNVYKID